MTDLKTVVFSSFNEQEKILLKEFKREVFYFVGEDLDNIDFWQNYFNLFFIYHYDLGDGITFAARRDLFPARAILFFPSVFSKLKGTDFFTDEKIIFGEEVTWYKEREFILSFFDNKESNIKFVESRISLIISIDHAVFLKKIKKIHAKNSYYKSNIYLLFLISMLILKKERFATSKLYNPYTEEELEKLSLYYEKFGDKLI